MTLYRPILAMARSHVAVFLKIRKIQPIEPLAGRMGEADESEPAAKRRQSKVGRLIEEYDLEGFGAELERLWTADEDRRSLRDLADYFNRKLLSEALDESDIQPLDGELQNTYRLLTDEEVSSAEATRIKRRLERESVDVEQLLDDFVTYQAIRTYLKDHRGAEYTPDETDPLKRELTNFQKLRGRMESVTHGKLEQLRDSDQFTLGEFQTLANIQVVCEDCNNQFDILELLDQGGCYCNDQ